MTEEGQQALVSTFCKYAGANPTSVEPIQAHASRRIIARITDSHGKSLVGSFEPFWPEAEAFLYLAKHFRSHALNTPEILFVDSPHQVILMEDLGHQTLYELLKQERMSESDVPESIERLYQRALTDLPRFQYEAGHLVDFSKCYPTTAFCSDDMKADCLTFVESVIDIIGIKGDRAGLERELGHLVQSLSQDTSWKTFMYRDFQSRNIVVKGRTLGYIDFQGGRRGPLAYDVASLLYQSRTALAPSVRARLLSTYCKAAATIPGFDEERFRGEFDEWVLIRLLQAVGRAGELGLKGDKELFRSSLPKGLLLLQTFLRHAQLSFEPAALRGYIESLVATYSQ